MSIVYPINYGVCQCVLCRSVCSPHNKLFINIIITKIICVLEATSSPHTNIYYNNYMQHDSDSAFNFLLDIIVSYKFSTSFDIDYKMCVYIVAPMLESGQNGKSHSN